MCSRGAECGNRHGESGTRDPGRGHHAARSRRDPAGEWRASRGGAPVEVRFAGPIADRPAAERTISITSPRQPIGEFTWLDDSVVQWNPDGFWPAHSKITVTAGGASTSSNRRFGGRRADISAHTFTVSIDEQVMREMPASMGKSRFPTPVGSFSVLRKERTVVMDLRER